MPKGIERVVYDQFCAVLKQSFNFIQHGFLKGRFVVTNLVLLNDFLTSYMDNGRQVGVVYPGHSKAFDRIRHNLHVCKLQNVCINGDLLMWLMPYINNRSQALVVNKLHLWVAYSA